MILKETSVALLKIDLFSGLVLSSKMQFYAASVYFLAFLQVVTSADPSLKDIATAQQLWSNDITRVSQFLRAAPGLSAKDVAFQAGISVNIENDETTQKSVLDAEFVTGSHPDPAVQSADNVLTVQKTVAEVVGNLTDLANNGASFDHAQIIDIIDKINDVRCNRVLPAINVYFQAVDKLLNRPLTSIATLGSKQCP
jgi:hypothetical protein